MNRKIGLFRKSKNVSFTENLPKRSQKRHSSANQTLFIYTSLSLLPIQKKPFPPSISHLHPAITYCPLKNDAALVISALTPYAVTPNLAPIQSLFATVLCEKPVSARAVGSISKSIFDRALNRPRESRGPQPSACFCGTFCTPQKVPKNVPLQGASRFCKPRKNGKAAPFRFCCFVYFSKICIV